MVSFQKAFELRTVVHCSLSLNFFKKWNFVLSYLNLVSFINMSFVTFFFQIYKTPDAIILGVFLSGFS